MNLCRTLMLSDLHEKLTLLRTIIATQYEDVEAMSSNPVVDCS